MAEEKKRKVSVGLIIMTKSPTGELVAVLQRRGRLNDEKDWMPESYPGAYQVTAHGKVEEGEDTHQALHREIGEELGGVLAKVIGVLEPALLVAQEEKKTFGVFIERVALKHIRLHPSTGGLCFVNQADADSIQNLRKFNKEIGVTDLNTIAMFPDEFGALRIAFEKFKRFA